jgi:DNA-directed RNA polymerase specialized sigma24 family protein
LTIYEQLRSIGVSVETADALEPILEGLPDKKREAFFLWACGMNYRQISKATSMPRSTIFDLVKYVRRQYG